MCQIVLFVVCKTILIYEFLLCVCIYSDLRRRIKIDMRDKWSLYNSGWNPNKKNAIIIHGFNGAENNRIMVILRNGNIFFNLA